MTILSQTGRRPQMLLIDDNGGDVALIEIAFEASLVPVELSVSPSAEEGLEFLRRQGAFAASPRPDLILLDLNLPRMSGLSFLAEIKHDPELVTVPVIVLSSSNAATDVAASYAQHANGFVTKPFSLDGYEELVASVNGYWFNLVELLDRGSSQARPGALPLDPAGA